MIGRSACRGSQGGCEAAFSVNRGVLSWQGSSFSISGVTGKPLIRLGRIKILSRSSPTVRQMRFFLMVGAEGFIAQQGALSPASQLEAKLAL